jgi:hypothetical protein
MTEQQQPTLYQAVVIRESSAQTPDQVALLLSDECRSICRGRLFVFDVDRSAGDSSIAAWVNLIPPGSALPYVFLADAYGSIVWQGPLPAGATAVELAERLLKYQWSE